MEKNISIDKFRENIVRTLSFKIQLFIIYTNSKKYKKKNMIIVYCLKMVLLN